MLHVKYLWNNGSPQNRATITAYSAAPAVINPSTIDAKQFLREIFFDHASKNQKKKNLNNPGDWICSDLLLNGGAFGYVVVNLDANSNSKLSL